MRRWLVGLIIILIITTTQTAEYALNVALIIYNQGELLAIQDSFTIAINVRLVALGAGETSQSLQESQTQIQPFKEGSNEHQRNIRTHYR